jgi:molybdenum cofactor cytidylyltransferase
MAILTAVILAAGRSTRMGSPKPLMRLEKTTFLGRLMTVYSHLGLPVRVVLGPDWEVITRQQPVPEVSLFINPKPELGPLSSLRVALDDLGRGVSGIVLHPVDHPLVRLDTVRRLVRLHEQRPDRILIPAFQGKNGHPTLFPSRLFDELRNAPMERGARAVVYSNPGLLLTFPTDDPGILQNIDTPEDYARWVEH